MIKEKPEGIVRTRGKNVSNTKQHIPRLRVRQGVSRKVLNSAERLMKEYQADLDYLKDR